jgi:hypothetical protein
MFIFFLHSARFELKCPQPKKVGDPWCKWSLTLRKGVTEFENTDLKSDCASESGSFCFILFYRHAGTKGERGIVLLRGQFHTSSMFTPRMDPRYRLGRRLGGPQSWSGHRDKI